MASANITALTNYGGSQTPADLTYIGKSPFGVTDDRKSTLNDLFSTITKNITDGAVRYQGFAAPALSAAGQGSMYFDFTSNTWQGSRNASAYANLLFGSGGNQRVTVWTSTSDLLTGFAEFIYQPTGSGVGNKVVRITVSGSSQDAQFFTDNTFASTPSSGALTNFGALNLIRLTTGSFPLITLKGGRSGPAFPSSLDVIGKIQVQSFNNTTTNEASYVQTIASQNHTNLLSGSAIEIWNTKISAALATRRMIIGAGAVGSTVAINVQSTDDVTTSWGTVASFVVGSPTTVDNLAQVMISGQGAGTTGKELVIQARASQTGNIFECQDSTGAILYSISAAGVPSAAGAITVGTTTITSGTTKRLLFDNAGVVGETAGFEYQSGASPNINIKGQTNVDNVLEIRGFDTPATAGLIGGFPALLTLHTLDDASYYAFAFRDDANGFAANYLTGGQLFFDIGNTSSVVQSSFSFVNDGSFNFRLGTGTFAGLKWLTPDGMELGSPATGNILRLEPTTPSISVLPIGAAVTELRFLELAANGANYVGFKAPDSIASNKVWTLPSADGTSGQALVTNGSGVLSWATAGGITIGTTTITSGTTTKVLFNNAGVVGEYTVTGTGNAVLSASPTLTGTVAMAAQSNSGVITQTSASATAFESGPNGGTNPVFRLVNSTASAATGLSITGNAAGSGVTLTALSSGADESIILTPKGSGAIQFPSTVTAGGTTGAQTINKVSGTVNFAAAATTLVVTNSLVTTSSLVFCEVRTNDTTATIKNVVPASGSFTITLTAAATAETSVCFWVINQ